MSIADIFSAFRSGTPATTQQPGSQQQQANQQTQSTPGNIPNNVSQTSATANSPATAPNGVIPASTDLTEKTKSPLDEFSELWKNDNSGTQNTPQPLFNSNQEDFIKAAQKTDFKTLIKPEQLQAISAGGDGAMNAFAEALNSVAQQVYANSTYAATKLIEGALNKSNTTLKSEIPGIIKQHSVNDSLNTENPAFSHPAAQPIISALKDQFAVKYPNATVKELTDHAKNFLGAFADIAGKKPEVQTKSKQSNETDWESFLG